MENTTSLPYGADYHLYCLRFCSRNDRKESLRIYIFQWFLEYIRWICPCISRGPTSRTRSKYISVGISFADVFFEEYHKTQESEVCTMGWGTHVPPSMWIHTEYDALCY